MSAVRTSAPRALLVLALLGAAAPSAAQRGPARRGPQDRAQLEERIRARMGEMIQRRLGLDDEQAARLSAVAGDFERQRRDLAAQEQATRRRVEALMREGSQDQDEARELVEAMADIRAKEAELFRAEQNRLLEVLSPMQVLQLQTMREQLGQRIRELRRGSDGGAGTMRRPGGPGDGGPAPRGPGG